MPLPDRAGARVIRIVDGVPIARAVYCAFVLPGDGYAASRAMTLTRSISMVALIGVLATLILGLAGRASTDLDIAAHLMGHALVMLPFAAFALWRDRWVPLVLAIGVLCGIGLPVIASLGRVDHLPPKVDESASVRVLSINTWHRHGDHDRLVAAIERHDADVVLLYEFGPDKLPLLGRLEARYPHRVGCPEMRRCAVVMLSRTPLLASGRVLGDRGTRPPVAWGQLAHGITVVGTHLERPLDSPDGHVAEIRFLARLAGEVPQPVVMAGDFNTTRWAESFRVFAAESGLKHMGRFLPSWPAGPLFVPQIGIDHAWASKGLAFEQLSLGADVGSDHLPLVFDIRRVEP